ncbi:MAG: glycoside hydrolase family 92 protein [Ferruginibacter sp.]|nr:glycoside hydrolase family 92 protein [Ferruginibacter sp.]
MTGLRSITCAAYPTDRERHAEWLFLSESLRLARKVSLQPLPGSRSVHFPFLTKVTRQVNLTKYLILIILLLLTQQLSSQNLIQYVQPFSGTAPSTTTASLKHSEAGSEKNANTIPAVGLPFAMTQWTPQTRTTEIKCQPPYFYKDSLLSGFRGSHWLSGSCTQDYGSFTIMPVCGKLKTGLGEYSVPFSHGNETTSPAYYKLYLPAQQLSTEITATPRCGIMQFTSAKDDSLYLLIIPNSDQSKYFVQLDVKNGVAWGYNTVHRIYQGWGEQAGFNGWFYVKIEKAVTSSGTFSGSKIFSADSISNKKDAGAFVGFIMKKGEQLRIRIGTSFSSLEGAKKNLASEIGSKSFDEILTAANKTWEEALAQVTVQGKVEKDKRIFYTALYHAMQHPRLFSDVDGTYPKFAGNYELKKMADGNYYDDFSMWDIYRAQLPLLEILKPALTNEWVSSLVLKGEQGGWLPIFPCWNSYTAAMIGDHVTAFIASAYNNGIRNYDVQKAYRLMRKNAFETANPKDYKNGMGRRALPSYLKYGFIPMEDSVPEAFHKKEQVSRTLEYAFDDYALSLVAKGLNKTADYRELQQRSLNYKNLYDPTVGMMRGRYANRKWFESFHPDLRESYITEGTPRQYSFYVPHDVPGLAKLMGGTKQLENALDSLFTKNEYWHGNEPGHQIPFMYNFTASPWKTQQQVRKILAEEYSDGPGGLSGNDDAGQMSAWYIFAAMGLYPVDPVSGAYQLCSPLFDKISLQLPENKKLEIVCTKKREGAVYISGVKWNGKWYKKYSINYSDIMKGGKLEFELQDTPAK